MGVGMRQSVPGKSTATQAVPAVALDTPLRFLKGVGPQRAAQLERLELRTVGQALLHLPARHEDRTQLTPLGRVTPGDGRTCAGTVAGVSPPPRGRPRVPLAVL